MTVRHDETPNILEEGPLHRVMVFFQRAENLPRAGVFLLQLAAGLGVALLWSFFRSPFWPSLFAAALVLCASIYDACFFQWLPRKNISFGPWKAQTVVLLLPRTIAAALLALPVPFVGWLLALVLLTLAQVSGCLLLWWAAAIETQRLSLTYLEARLSSLPPAAPPVRILHISDIHLERLTGRERDLLALSREAQPDLIVLTGDYLNLSYSADDEAQRQVAQLLEQLEAPYGVFATLGSPPVDRREEIVPILDRLPLQLLRDEWVEVKLETGSSLVLLGVDCTHYLDQDAERLAHVTRVAPNGVPRVLLYHSPELMPQATAHGIDLYVCGHTHGGQVRLPLIGPLLTSSRLGRRYVMGHYREGETNLYVSRGVGLEGLSAPRVRLLAPPEITMITLRPER